MKILFILELYKPHVGWVETLFSNLISNLIDDWHKITILTSKFKSDLPDYDKLDNWVEIFRVGHNRYDFMLYSISPWIKLAKNCNIIHTTTYNAAIPANIIAKITGKKIVLTVHEIFGKLWYKFMWFKWFFYKLFESIIFLFNFDKYICVSNYTKNCLRVYSWIDDNKLITVYNWIDYDLWNQSNVSQDKIKLIKEKYKLNWYFTWFFWWRPGVSKWLEYYIEAIPYIRKQILNFKAFLVIPRFDKDRVSYIESLISKLDPDSYVINNEFVPNEDLPNFISSTDFVIIPSLAEWFWFNVVESCSIWQKIITTNIWAIPEVVSGKVIFIEPSSSESIIEAVICMYNNKFSIIPEKQFIRSKNEQNTLKVYNEVLWK